MTKTLDESEPCQLKKPCRYCEAPFGFRVLVKRHWDIYCGACGTYQTQEPKEPEVHQFFLSPDTQTPTYKRTAARFIRLLEESPTLTRYREGKLLPPGPSHGASPDGRYIRRQDETEDQE
jgi:hypothetical protein